MTPPIPAFTAPSVAHPLPGTASIAASTATVAASVEFIPAAVAPTMAPSPLPCLPLPAPQPVTAGSDGPGNYVLTSRSRHRYNLFGSFDYSDHASLMKPVVSPPTSAAALIVPSIVALARLPAPRPMTGRPGGHPGRSSHVGTRQLPGFAQPLRRKGLTRCATACEGWLGYPSHSLLRGPGPAN